MEVTNIGDCLRGFFTLLRQYGDVQLCIMHQRDGCIIPPGLPQEAVSVTVKIRQHRPDSLLEVTEWGIRTDLLGPDNAPPMHFEIPWSSVLTIVDDYGFQWNNQPLMEEIAAAQAALEAKADGDYLLH
jgi:hypothetical protein